MIPVQMVHFTISFSGQMIHPMLCRHEFPFQHREHLKHLLQMLIYLMYVYLTKLDTMKRSSAEFMIMSVAKAVLNGIISQVVQMVHFTISFSCQMIHPM